MRARIRSRSPISRSDSASADVARRFDQGRNRLVARAQRIAVAQRPMQPAAQHPRAHRGGRTIEHAGKGQLRFAGEALVEFKIAAGRRDP